MQFNTGLATIRSVHRVNRINRSSRAECQRQIIRGGI